MSLQPGFRLAAGILAFAAASGLIAQETPPARPRIGLALGGGGARGMAHIGVIRALEELRIPIDYIAGTSMGSVVGGLYACGYTPDQLEALIKSIKWETLFQDAPERPQQSFRQKEDDFDHLIPLEFGFGLKKGLVLPPGLIAGSKLGYVLQSATLPCASVGSFDELRIPFRAVATDVQTGAPVIMSSGNLARAIRASMAIPAIFTPVELDDRLLIDGGESQNLPVQTVKAMGADVVIAVNVGESGAASAAKPRNVGAMIVRLIDLPLQQNTAASAKLADLVITPDLTGYTSGDFPTGAQMIVLGQKAGLAEKGRLERYSAEPGVFDSWKRNHDATLPPLPVIDAIEIDPVPDLDPRRIEYLVQTKAGKPLDTAVLGQDLKRIYSLGLFEIVSYEILETDGRRILRISPTPKSWGPTYLKLGLFTATDFQETTQFGVVALFDATELNALGAEWKTTLTFGSPLELKTRFFQPLSYRGRLFASPYGAWRQQNVQVYDDAGFALGTYQVSRGAFGLDLGYDFGTWGELRAGYVRAYGKARRKVGNPLFPDIDFDEGGILANLTVDQLDNVNFPRSGYLADVNFFAVRTGMGGTFSYDRFEAAALGAQTVGRWTGLARVQGGSGLGTDIPYYDEFQLGGLFRLSGRPLGQFTGDTYAAAALLMSYRITARSGAIVKNLYLGVSAEAGRTWAFQQPVTLAGFKTAGSVFAVADTLIGPLFFGYGYSDSKNTSAYLFLNRAF